MNTMAVNKSVVGQVENPNTYFGEQKADLFKRLGDISTIQIMLNRVWIAVWVRPSFKDLGNGKRLLLIDDTVAEDIYQGNSAMVVAMGPLAFAPNDVINFGTIVPKSGDWVLYHRHAAGMRFNHNGVPCIMLESETPIKAILSRPDLVE